MIITNTKGRNEGAHSLLSWKFARKWKEKQQTEQLVVIFAHLHAPGGVLYRSSQDLPSGTPAELSLLQKAKQHE